jgi:hypothetical protein
VRPEILRGGVPENRAAETRPIAVNRINHHLIDRVTAAPDRGGAIRAVRVEWPIKRKVKNVLGRLPSNFSSHPEELGLDEDISLWCR